MIVHNVHTEIVMYLLGKIKLYFIVERILILSSFGIDFMLEVFILI